MDIIKNIGYGIGRGLLDSTKGLSLIFNLNEDTYVIAPQVSKKTKSYDSSVLAQRLATRKNASRQLRAKAADGIPQLRQRLLQCCALNGGILLLSIFVFHQLILPWLHALVTGVFGHRSVWNWLRPLLACTFSALWVLPLFVISKVINCLWFQDIAEAAYRTTQGRPHLHLGLSMWVADTLFSILIQALFLIQGMFVSLVPIVGLGTGLGMLHMCLLYALYAFEYKWFNLGWELHKRLAFIEYEWPYFIGFGLPLAVLTSMAPSYVVSGCVFSIMFPVFIISGNEAEPVVGLCETPLQLFSPVIAISNAIFQRTVKPAALSRT